MGDSDTLADKSCKPCEGGAEPMAADAAAAILDQLDGWALKPDGKTISKRWTFKGFKKAQDTAMLAGKIADEQGHHPDIRHGFGYCEVDFTTHDAGGLTENDFICAAKIDAALR